MDKVYRFILHARPEKADDDWFDVLNSQMDYLSGWWFGTCFFHNIWDVILPIDSYVSEG